MLLLEGVVVHGVAAVAIIIVILLIIGFGVIGLARATGRGAKGVAHKISDRGDERS